MDFLKYSDGLRSAPNPLNPSDIVPLVQPDLGITKDLTSATRLCPAHRAAHTPVFRQSKRIETAYHG